MSRHLERDLEVLEQELLSMSALVEDMIERAWRSFTNLESDQADAVIELDQTINEQEVGIEEECLKILALHQPVAIDLRRTATILKVNNDLERIADLAVNIAERVKRLTTNFEVPELLGSMATTSRDMVRRSLNSLVAFDYDDAKAVCDTDDQVDQDHAQVIALLYEMMKEDSDNIAAAIHCITVARCLERIADHATNIAEDVMYLVRGDIERHRH